MLPNCWRKKIQNKNSSTFNIRVNQNYIRLNNCELATTSGENPKRVGTVHINTHKFDNCPNPSYQQINNEAFFLSLEWFGE